MLKSKNMYMLFLFHNKEEEFYTKWNFSDWLNNDSTSVAVLFDTASFKKVNKNILIAKIQ